MENKKTLYDRRVKSIPFFACLSDDEWEQVRHAFVEKLFSKNTIILGEQDTQKYMFIVLSGRVKVLHSGPDGTENILAIHSAGDFFGEMALLDGKTAPATLMAMENTRVALLTKKDFEIHFLNNTKVLHALIAVLCSRLRSTWVTTKLLSLPRAEDRIRAALKLLCSNHGTKDKHGTIISCKLTHQDIADYASVSRETVTRFLNKAVKKEEIEILDDKYLLLKHQL